MQLDTPFIFTSWRQVAFSLIALILGSTLSGILVKGWLERKHRQAIVENTDAQTDQIRIQGGISAADAMERMFERIEIAHASRDLLREQNMELQGHISKRDREIAFQDKEIKKLKAILTVNNIKYSDYDNIKVD